MLSCSSVMSPFSAFCIRFKQDVLVRTEKGRNLSGFLFFPGRISFRAATSSSSRFILSPSKFVLILGLVSHCESSPREDVLYQYPRLLHYVLLHWKNENSANRIAEKLINGLKRIRRCHWLRLCLCRGRISS